MSGEARYPTTMEGKLLASFLRGLLPEAGDQFARQIADIESAARLHCPCAWQCHETPSPCSMSCMAHHFGERVAEAMKDR